MKIIGLALGFFLSFSAFTSTYFGVGEWKSNNDEDFGNYSVSATIELVDDNTITINQTLTFENEVLQFNVVLLKINDNFYDVVNEQGDYIGDGYCWLLGENEKICHSVTHENGYVVESTIKKTADAIYRIGSKINLANYEKIIWKDELFLQSSDN